MLKEFFLKQMVKSQMKGVPPEEQERILKLVGENPVFFEGIAKEIQEKQAKGMDQVSAVIEVVTKHKEELSKMMGK